MASSKLMEPQHQHNDTEEEAAIQSGTVRRDALAAAMADMVDIGTVRKVRIHHDAVKRYNSEALQKVTLQNVAADALGIPSAVLIRCDSSSQGS